MHRQERGRDHRNASLFRSAAVQTAPHAQLR